MDITPWSWGCPFAEGPYCTGHYHHHLYALGWGWESEDWAAWWSSNLDSVLESFQVRRVELQYWMKSCLYNIISSSMELRIVGLRLIDSFFYVFVQRRAVWCSGYWRLEPEVIILLSEWKTGKLATSRLDLLTWIYTNLWYLRAGLESPACKCCKSTCWTLD